jgi:hypothetical protein
VDTLTNHSGSLTGTFDSTFEFLNIDSGYRIQCVNTNGSTQDTDITTFTITEIGAVAEYDGSGIASDRWLDKSGNDLHGTVSGATVENAPSGDDGLVYEEGTFTPAVSTAGGSISKTGYYTRIGNIVNFQISIQNIAATGASGWVVSNLPYTSDSTFGGGGYLVQTEKIDYAGVGQLNFSISTGVTQFSMNFAEDDATRTIAVGTHFNASDCGFQVVGQYRV